MLAVKLFVACFVLGGVSAIKNFQYEKGAVSVLSSCPGYYCGRTHLENGSWSACGPCDIGFRRNASSACVACTDSPSFYDWLYLGFMAFLVLIFHIATNLWNDISSSQTTLQSVLSYGFPILELVVSAVLSLLIFEPRGSLGLQSCSVGKFADWYPIFHNPNPSYEGYLHCTQEAVFPLYSIVFMFYMFCLITMVVIRPWVAYKWFPNGKYPIYYAMYFLPLIMLIHALLAGLIYYSFPSIIIIASLLGNAVFFTMLRRNALKYLLVETFYKPRRVLILMLHWFTHAYGIISFDLLEHPGFLVLVPFPAFFYILTAKHSDPYHFTTH